MDNAKYRMVHDIFEFLDDNNLQIVDINQFNKFESENNKDANSRASYNNMLSSQKSSKEIVKILIEYLGEG